MPVPFGCAFADALPNAHFHVLPGCGHLPTLEKSAECAVLIGPFLLVRISSRQNLLSANFSGMRRAISEQDLVYSGNV